MDFSLQQSIKSAVTSAVAIVVAVIQTKYENEILFLQEMIKKSLLLRNSPSVTPFLNLDTTLKPYLGANFLSKTTTERWN